MKLMSKIFYLLKEGFVSVFSHGFMSFASVTIIVACLIIMGSFSLLSVNIDAVIKKAEDENQILAYIDESLTVEEAEALGERIRAIENVSSAEFVVREQAMEDFVERYENQTFQGIEAEVFRHRFTIFMHDISLMEVTRDEVLSIVGVDKVNAAIEISRGFIMVRNIVNTVSLVLIVILVTVSMFIMANTVKLTTFGRREEIAIMKMVGATNTFIRTPFVVEGMSLGLLGSGIAFGVQWGIYRVVTDKIISSVAGNFVSLVPFEAIMWPILFIFLGVGFAVGAFGGIVAIRNYLKV